MWFAELFAGVRIDTWRKMLARKEEEERLKKEREEYRPMAANLELNKKKSFDT